jgi:hypothetical protein
MAARREPMIDLVYNDETGRYIGMLESKILYYQLNDLRFRALLELLTDQDWDDYQFSEEDGEIKRLAVDALKRRLGLTHEDAHKLVAERWAGHNPPPAPEHTRTYLIGKTPTPHVVSQARPMADQPASPGYDVDKHLQGIKVAKRHMEEFAANSHEAL